MKDLIIRAGTPDDIPAIVSLGIEALERDPYPGLVISKDKVKALAMECVTGAGNASFIAEYKGEVVAAVSAIIHEQMVYERKQATVVQYYTRKAGAGIEVMRAFLEWAKPRRGIKNIIFTLEARGDERIGKLLNRMGFELELPVYMRTR